MFTTIFSYKNAILLATNVKIPYTAHLKKIGKYSCDFLCKNVTVYSITHSLINYKIKILKLLCYKSLYLFSIVTTVLK
jgi:hypothetical protein